MTRTTTDLGALLADAAARHGLPGASLAVLEGERIDDAVTGVTSLATGIEVTPDTLFQIGSITKVYTTTLLMQLVDEGSLSLDQPVTDVLPAFRVDPPDRTSGITLRTLLSHTCGIEGDVFDDLGRGDDCVERYVDAITGRELIHEPGEMFSYCNAGFVLAGRIIEVLRARSWDRALAEHLIAPLGLERTLTLPEDVILHRVAIGHGVDPATKEPVPASTWHLPRATGPAGAISATARDVLAFARLHLDGGRDGVLSSTSVRAMQHEQVRVPFVGTMADAWGIGWLMSDWDGERVIGHNGGTLGQTAFLRIVPARGFAMCLLTNARTGGLLAQELFREVFALRLGIHIPRLPEPSGTVPDEPERFVGAYVRANHRIDIALKGGALVAAITPEDILAINTPAMVDIPLDHQGGDAFLVRLPAPSEPVPLTFIDGGRSLHTGGRVSRRA